MKFLMALIFFASPLAAQIHVGVKAGAPLTDVTETVSTSTVLMNLPSRWTVGPMVELDLPFGFGVEANALYRRVGYQRIDESGGPPSQEHPELRDGLWDFPVIAKYKFAGTLGRPYLGGGWTYRSLNDLLDFSSSNGWVLVGGVRINALALKVSPEIRYTRWAGEGREPGFRTNRKQVEILVGITF